MAARLPGWADMDLVGDGGVDRWHPTGVEKARAPGPWKVEASVPGPACGYLSIK